MNTKAIKKERNSTIALLTGTIISILINIVAVVLNLRALIISPVFDLTSLLFALACTVCVVGLSTFIPDNLRTIKKCNGLLEGPHQ